MADLSALLKSQHEEVLSRFNELTLRVEQFLDARAREVPGVDFTNSVDTLTSDSADSSVPLHSETYFAIPPQEPDEQNAQPDASAASGQATPVKGSGYATPLRGSGQVTPVKGRRKAIHDYVEAKEEGYRVETLKRNHSANVALHSDQRRSAMILQACQRWAEVVSKSIAFNVAVALVIISNSMFLGLQLEVSVHDADGSTARWFLLGHFCYAILFSLEMVVRVVALGPRGFLCGPDFAWNWLDLCIVFPAWIELAVDFVQLQTVGAGTSNSNFRVIRVFRVTRVLQVIRSVRLVRFISAFRELVISVLDTVRQLVWAMVLLLLVIYSFGILFTDAVLQHMDGADDGALENLEKLQHYFGGVYDSSTTLFRTLLAGFDWIDAADALMPLGVVWVQLFHIYVAFGDFALLNVITGVFVNSAIKTRERDHETLMHHVHAFKKLVETLWRKLDTTGLGQITITEFEQMFQDEDMVAFFAAIEVSAVDAWTLFDSLDADGDHLISYEEFAERCLQLHGAARSVDLFALKQQADKLEDKLDKMFKSQVRTNSHIVSLSNSMAGQTRQDASEEFRSCGWRAGGDLVAIST